ncbi:hypothetical protein C5167_037335 [Papaver somniferum]|uniref:KOW domain-containing protein n=1 Tax=Papaver somniferum TaxID=3469 RepID=A0A4Y7IA55_PAPSO|nr:hypothetical protein C5167_037335 [Papaver somniferum]
MQSFYKGLRCHLTSSNVSKISGLRGFIASVGSPLKSETKCSSPLESSAYHRRSCASSTCRIHGVGISKWGAFGPAFTTRSMTTDAHPREPIIDKEQVQAVKEHRDFPDIQPGDTVQLKVEVPDNKRRVQTLKGTVIARRNAGLHSTFRIRRMLAGVGVESVYPLYSPNIKEMKVLNKNKARRAKLYYLRDRKNALKKQ